MAAHFRRRLSHGFFCGHDHFRDTDEFKILLAGELLKSAECVGLVEAGPLHQDAFCAFDRLSIFQCLPQIGRLLLERTKVRPKLRTLADQSTVRKHMTIHTVPSVVASSSGP